MNSTTLDGNIGNRFESSPAPNLGLGTEVTGNVNSCPIPSGETIFTAWTYWVN
jgi:hypothetical protein